MEHAMIDLNNEQLISFQKAAQLVPVPVTMHTIRNWALYGAHGVPLDFLKIGARYYTSAEALQRFLDNCRANGWQGIWSGRSYEDALNPPRE
jgi:hypothetical protein